jgi:hypothetical protein
MVFIQGDMQHRSFPYYTSVLQNLKRISWICRLRLYMHSAQLATAMCLYGALMQHRKTLTWPVATKPKTSALSYRCRLRLYIHAAHNNEWLWIQDMLLFIRGDLMQRRSPWPNTSVLQNLRLYILVQAEVIYVILRVTMSGLWRNQTCRLYGALMEASKVSWPNASVLQNLRL